MISEYPIIMVPKLDGLTLCRRLRAEGNRALVVLLTARNTVQDKVPGLDTGADDYLTKPFAFAELLARVRALLRRGGPQQPTRLKAADLELDPARVSLAIQESGVYRVWNRRPVRACGENALRSVGGPCQTV